MALDKPVIENVPPMQKRRLSPLARVVFHVLDSCVEPQSQAPVVFSSYMGEIKRTQGILDTLAINEAVSPAAFSLSVHNSIGGLWSLIRGNRGPVLALASPNGSPVAALLEAAGMLAEGQWESVTVVFYEEEFPQFYAPYLQGPPASQALAITLVDPDANVPNSFSCDLTCEQHLHPEGSFVGAWSSPLGMLDCLTGVNSEMTIVEPGCTWLLQREKQRSTAQTETAGVRQT